MSGQENVVVGRTEGTSLVEVATRVLKDKRVLSFGVLWMIGLYVVFFASAAQPLGPQELQSFMAALEEAEAVQGLDEAYEQVMMTRAELNEHKVWFWRWRLNDSQKQVVYELEDQLEKGTGGSASLFCTLGSVVLLCSFA
eukprot:m.47831 g.47831  ORF g.47831 m.47831 type:complete len:140 (-) comp11003_c0_seq2:993-1412(-)